MDVDYFRRRMKQREVKGGIVRLDVHDDGFGNPTVGYGHKVTTADNLEIGDKITEKQADLFFENDIAYALNIIEDAPWIATLPENKRFVMHDMAYNMGYAKLKGTVEKGFPNFFAMMHMYSQSTTDDVRKYYAERAASELKYRNPTKGNMQLTDYYQQVKTRAYENYDYILNGTDLMEY
jgi:hypothetical protein